MKIKLAIFLLFPLTLHAEYLISGSVEDIVVDYATACSIAGGSHNFNLNIKNAQISATIVGIGGQSCESIAFGKKITSRIFVETGYTYVRGDHAILIQSTYEIK